MREGGEILGTSHDLPSLAALAPLDPSTSPWPSTPSRGLSGEPLFPEVVLLIVALGVPRGEPKGALGLPRASVRLDAWGERSSGRAWRVLADNPFVRGALASEGNTSKSTDAARELEGLRLVPIRLEGE